MLMKSPIHITIKIEPEKIADIMETVLEGAIDYWATDIKVFSITGTEVEHLPALGTYRLAIFEGDMDNKGKSTRHNLSLTGSMPQIQKGLKLMAEEHPQHFGHFLSDWDCETADVFIQLCLFGEIRYG